MTSWPLILIVCMCMGHDHSSLLIESKGHGSRLQLARTLMRSVWRRSSIEFSFSSVGWRPVKFLQSMLSFSRRRLLSLATSAVKNTRSVHTGYVVLWHRIWLEHASMLRWPRSWRKTTVWCLPIRSFLFLLHIFLMSMWLESTPYVANVRFGPSIPGSVHLFNVFDYCGTVRVSTTIKQLLC